MLKTNGIMLLCSGAVFLIFALAELICKRSFDRRCKPCPALVKRAGARQVGAGKTGSRTVYEATVEYTVSGTVYTASVPVKAGETANLTGTILDILYLEEKPRRIRRADSKKEARVILCLFIVAALLLAAGGGLLIAAALA